MLLIGLAITVAFTASLATSLGIGDLDLDFWWELALLVVVMLLGHWLEMKAIGAGPGRARRARRVASRQRRARGRRRQRGGGADRGAAHSGDVVLVRSGARVPADGAIVDGAAEIDESMITGESRPVAKSVGRSRRRRHRRDRLRDPRARRRGRVPTPHSPGIERLVADAQASRRRARRCSPTAPRRCCSTSPPASAVVTFVVWMAVGDANAAVENTVTVLVIACPHALGLAIPLVDRAVAPRWPRTPGSW